MVPSYDDARKGNREHNNSRMINNFPETKKAVMKFFENYCWPTAFMACDGWGHYRYIVQRSAEATTDDNGDVQITATIDGHSKTITEASLRRHLKLDDHDVLLLYPTQRFLSSWHSWDITQIQINMQKKQLQQHSRTYPVPSLSIKVFNNMKRPTKGYSGQEVDLFPTMLNVSEPSTSPSRITSSPFHSPEPSIEHSPDHTTAAVSFPSPTQPTQPSPGELPISLHPMTRPLHAVHSHGSDDCAVVTKLILSVKKLEAKVKAGTSREKSRVVHSEDDARYVTLTEVNQVKEAYCSRTVTYREGVKMDFNQHIEPVDLELGSEKMKSPEKIEEEDVDTQKEMKEVSKESGAKRKKSIPRKSTRSSVKRQKIELDDEKEDLKGYLDIVPREDVAEDVESLSTKYPIVDWKTCVLTENFMYYQIFRGDGSSKNYKVLSEMLEDFDRQDVMDLHRLVKERYSASRPEGYDLMLWGDLHTLFEPDEEDEIWKNQHEYNLISWSLCDFCGVHILLMQNGIAIHMFTEKKYPLSQEMLSKMLSKRLEVDHESTQAYELLKFIRSQVQK
ncbi:hypothetical protein Tco_1032229 [Tanacetum coccineum]|uniref:Uncharacterized protein n=1 Tax=Tanacetum coccineum TaxID=301880 RepID=A0ABQ5GB84_9ASTR